MRALLTDKEYSRMTNEYDKVKFKCYCGHRIIIPAWVDKQICRWCNNYVFRNKKDEFEYRIKERLKYEERNMEKCKKL